MIGNEASPLRYLDCMVILGICPVENIDESALLDGKTVFQTANGNERMYMMPYSPTTIMWQLSFPLPEEEAKALNRSEALNAQSGSPSQMSGMARPDPSNSSPNPLVADYGLSRL